MRHSRSSYFALALSRIAGGLAVAALAILPTLAATYIVPTDEVLIRKAESIVRGRVVAVAPVALPGGGIETHITVEVARVLKGSVAAARIVVHQPGGEIGDRGEYYPGIGGFAVDEQVLVMLDAPSSDLYRVTDFALGNFTVLTGSDGAEFLRRQGLTDAFILSPTSSDAHTAPPAGVTASAPEPDGATPSLGGAPSPTGEPDRDASAFERYIVAVGSGLSPRADYVLPAPKPTTDRFAAFTFLGNPPARWSQFDTLTPVVYKDNASGDSGSLCSNGCHDQIASAPAIWSAATGTKILLQYGGTDNTVGGKCLPELDNQINFDDPCGELSDLSGCAGTLALGGFSSSSTSGGSPSCPAMGNPSFHKITSAKIMVNNGSGSCLGACDYTSMITHETGHTIGAGHSGVSSALMAPFLNHGICGVLQPDDIAFAQCVYPGCAVSTVTSATAVAGTTTVKAIILGTGFKGGSIVQIDSGGGFVNAPVTKRKTGKKLVAKDIGAIWPAGVTVTVRVLAKTGCESSTIQAIR